MPIFQKSPEKTLQRDRDAALANRDRLAISLTTAEDAVISAKKLVQKRALEGDDTGLDAAEIAEAGTLRRLSTIETAFAAAEQILAKLDAQIAAASEKTLRAATAAEANVMADEFLQAAKTFGAAITILANISDRAVPIVYEASGLASFSASSRVEVPAAVDVVAALLRDHAKMVLTGMAPAILPTPEKPFMPTIAPKPVTRRLFTLRSVSWTNADGMLRIAQKFTDVDLPLDAADRAIAAKVCVEMNDPARKSNHHQWPGHPDPTQCYSLDEPSTTATAAPDEPVQFERLDRGKPYVVRTAAGGVV